MKDLERLEQMLAKFDQGCEMLAHEVFVGVMDLSCEVLAQSDSSLQDRANAEATIAAVETLIRDAAAAHTHDTWPAHLEWLEEVWTGAYYNGVREFVPSIIGWSHDDLEKPRVMERRRALRDRPDIARLIAEARSGA
jgi:hypothetical protein